jgi:hypothetical protein
VRGIGADGTLICEPVDVPIVSTLADDPANDVGGHSSMAIGTDGLPIISHRDDTANALRVTHCGNPSCSAGNVSTLADDPTPNSVGHYTSIAIGTDGRPVISHHDVTAGALRVTRCGDQACTTGNVTTILDDSANSVGQNSSIAIGVDGLPIISHHDATARTLRITRCLTVACTSGHSIIVDGPAREVGAFSSIAIGADGLPVISHLDFTALALRVTHCGDAACTSGNVSTTLDDTTSIVGLYTSIAIGSDGLPVISYADGTAQALRVTHCGDPACTAGNVSTTVDDPANSVGRFTSIAIGVDGLPMIGHQDATATAPRVTHCGNAACTAGNVSVTLETSMNAGYYTSLAIGSDGLPVISHQDVTAGTLRVTKCGTMTC